MTASTEADRRGRFEAIVAEVFEPLQRYVRRRIAPDDVQDVMSDVLLTLWRRLDDIPGGSPLPWCYGVARRTLANQRRRQGRHLRLLQRLAAEPPTGPDPDPDELDPVVAEALARLSSADQELLRLWAWERLEPREIAAVLGTTANAVSLRLTRAKKKLADEISRQNGAGPGHTQDRHAEGQTDD
jgi:RNA polymerase sigma-70 factor, ECF subfamily